VETDNAEAAIFKDLQHAMCPLLLSLRSMVRFVGMISQVEENGESLSV